MKKIFTLVAVALSAISANAQTESWNVNNADGTLKTDYVANTDPNAMSVVSFSTTNVTGTHTSGPVAGYIDGTTTPLEPKVDNKWGNINKKALSSDESVPTFYYVQGKGNPVNLDKVTWEEIVTDEVPTGMYRAYWNDSYYNPDGTAGLPKNGTYITLKAATDGKMRVAVWINKGSRDVYIAKASDCKALSFGTEAIASGYARSAYSGTYAPATATLTIESIAPALPSCFTDRPAKNKNVTRNNNVGNQQTMSEEERQRTLEEVNKQQAEFGVQ